MVPAMVTRLSAQDGHVKHPHTGVSRDRCMPGDRYPAHNDIYRPDDGVKPPCWQDQSILVRMRYRYRCR